VGFLFGGKIGIAYICINKTIRENVLKKIEKKLKKIKITLGY